MRLSHQRSGAGVPSLIFLWSSIPDDELLDVAIAGKLKLCHKDLAGHSRHVDPRQPWLSPVQSCVCAVTGDSLRSRSALRRGSLRLKKRRKPASPMPASWNQISFWLEQIDALRRRLRTPSIRKHLPTSTSFGSTSRNTTSTLRIG